MDFTKQAGLLHAGNGDHPTQDGTSCTDGTCHIWWIWGPPVPGQKAYDHVQLQEQRFVKTRLQEKMVVATTFPFAWLQLKRCFQKQPFQRCSSRRTGSTQHRLCRTCSKRKGLSQCRFRLYRSTREGLSRRSFRGCGIRRQGLSHDNFRRCVSMRKGLSQNCFRWCGSSQYRFPRCGTLQHRVYGCDQKRKAFATTLCLCVGFQQ